MTGIVTSVRTEHRRLREWLETAYDLTRRRESQSELHEPGYFDGMRAAYAEVAGYLDGRYEEIRDAPTERPVADDLALAAGILSGYLEAATQGRYLRPDSHTAIAARDLVARHRPELLDR